MEVLGKITNKVVEGTKGAVKAVDGSVGKVADKGLDYAKAGIGLALAGVDKTFEVSGVHAGFQAVMSGLQQEVDTSDEGLEALYEKIDADGSGSIDEQEMTSAITELYGTPLKPALVAEMMAAADTDKDGRISLDEFKVMMRAGPKKPPKDRPSPILKPKHIMGVSGDTPEGKPADALGYIAEGGGLFGEQYSPAKFLLSQQLHAKGLSGAQWSSICFSLRRSKGPFGIGGGFRQAIVQANEDYLDKIGCVGVYAEYGAGQKVGPGLPACISPWPHLHSHSVRITSLIPLPLLSGCSPQAMVVLTKEVAQAGRATFPP
jgi:hypothetical protein